MNGGAAEQAFPAVYRPGDFLLAELVLPELTTFLDLAFRSYPVIGYCLYGEWSASMVANRTGTGEARDNDKRWGHNL